MLTWTEAGAVERPTRLQIRVQRAYPGRVRAGAPVPTRSMTDAEIEANLEFFTRGMSGPRTAPSTHLVLSGVGVAARASTPGLLDRARSLGMEHIVLHVGSEDLSAFAASRFRGRVDVVVVPVQAGTDTLAQGTHVIEQCRAQGIDVVANTLLSAAALPSLLSTSRALVRACPTSVTFTHPFPTGDQAAVVAAPAAVRAALREAVPEMERAGIRVAIRGLPACYLPGLEHLAGRSANRWYVDADHQGDEAILFFPGVARFHKVDACRFCRLDGACDGFFAAYLREPGFPPLEPVQ